MRLTKQYTFAIIVRTKDNLQKTSTSTATVETAITIEPYLAATIEIWTCQSGTLVTETENSLRSQPFLLSYSCYW